MSIPSTIPSEEQEILMKKPKDIFFFIRENPFGFLSNFERAMQAMEVSTEEIEALKEYLPVKTANAILRHKAILFDCNERYYQYRKAKAVQDRALILQASVPYLCMVIGHGFRAGKEMRDDWTEEVRIATMQEGVDSKFFQNPDLADRLLATGRAKLHEKNRKDPFWGIGDDRTAKDNLGKCLESTRTKLKVAKKRYEECDKENGHCRACSLEQQMFCNSKLRLKYQKHRQEKLTP